MYNQVNHGTRRDCESKEMHLVLVWRYIVAEQFRLHAYGAPPFLRRSSALACRAARTSGASVVSGSAVFMNSC